MKLIKNPLVICGFFRWRTRIDDSYLKMDSKDSSNSAIFSLRIVSVDNYMKTPLFGLDTCYSDFRADEVKQVSVTCYYNCI